MAILCESPPTAHELAPSIGGDVRIAESLSVVAAILAEDPTETLVVLGPSMPSYEALDFAERLRSDRPAVGVILAREQLDNALLIQALQAGVREVVPTADPSALAAACYRSRAVSQRVLDSSRGGEKAPDGKVITVFAPKGGVGKTTLSINLALALSEGTGQRVCLVDLDLAFGEVAISIGLDPTRTILDAVPMAGHVDPTGAESLLIQYRPGLETLLAPLVPGLADRISPELVAELLAVLRGMFDFIVVDTPPDITDHVLTAFDVSDHHVFITTPELPTLKNLRVALDTLDQLSYPKEIRSIVLNRAGSKVGLSPENLERVLQCPVTVRVPSSRAVTVSINRGVPIVLGQPKHQVSRAIIKFADELRETPARKTRARQSPPAHQSPSRQPPVSAPQPRGAVGAAQVEGVV